MMTLEELVAQDEGLELRVYQDSMGVLTIGYGRNLQDIGISLAEAQMMRANDCQRARNEANTLGFFATLDPVRQLVIESMLFQLGMSRFLMFQQMIHALNEGDYESASAEMLNSLWAKQAPKRAKKLAIWMQTGICE